MKSIADFPREVKEDMFVLIECKGKEDENVLGAYETEIEALKIFRRVSHKDKVIIKANVIYAQLPYVKCIYGYEEI